MISARARDSFDLLLAQALSENLVAARGGRCQVEPLAGKGDLREAEFVILTISSYLFRAMVLFHFNDNAATRAHFARLVNTSPEAMDRKAFEDAVAEFGNLCCGALNRELGRHFPHVGMSTPNLLEGSCILHLGALQAGYLRHYQVEVEGDTRFHATLCVCDYGDLDFRAERQRVVEAAVGELELF